MRESADAAACYAEGMYAVIVGAGEVGFHIATILSEEGHDVAVIDRSQEAFHKASQELDVLAIQGNGASRRVLEQVNIGKADLLIAVTNSDEVNMIACMAGKRVGVAQTIARVRNPEYIEDFQTLSTGLSGIDHVIQPEAAVADEVARLATIPGVLDVESFAGGQVWVLEANIDSRAPSAGTALHQLSLPKGAIITGILRHGVTTIPRGGAFIEPGDRVFVAGRPEIAAKAVAHLTGEHEPARRAVLLGCGEIGMGVAVALEKQHVRLTIFEKNPQRAAEAAAALRRTRVLSDEGIDEKVLVAEGVTGADLFIAATGDDRLNILSSLMAKQLGAKRTISVVERSEFSRVVESVGVDVAISPRRMTASAVLRFVRAGQVTSAAVLEKSAGEVLEFMVSDRSPVCGRELMQVDFPQGAIVGAVVRDHEVHIPDGHFQLRQGDLAVVFTAEEAVRRVEKLFASRQGR